MRTRFSVRFAICLVIVLAACVCLTSCGGSGGGSNGDVSAVRNAKATFSVTWPETGKMNAASIPTATNEMIVFVSGPGIRTPIAAIVPRPAGGSSTSTVTLDLPAGPRRLFSAEARRVTSPPSGIVTNPTKAQLLAGTVLASGNDGTPHDIAPFAKVAANISLKPGGTPGGGVIAVSVTITNIETTDFPLNRVVTLAIDQDHNVLSNLTRANFKVTEDGVDCIITDARVLQQTGSSISVVLTLDRTGSMDGQPAEDLDTAATTFVDLLQPGDKAEIINFGGSLIEVTQPFTDDKSALRAAIQEQQWRFGSVTPLWDSLFLAINEAKLARGIAAVVAMTDGGENASEYHYFSDVLNEATTANLPVFSVGLHGYDWSPDPLIEISEATGAFFTEAPDSGKLDEIYTAISNTIRAQIVVVYQSPNPNHSSSPRTVVVEYKYGSFQGTATQTYVY